MGRLVTIIIIGMESRKHSMYAIFVKVVYCLILIVDERE